MARTISDDQILEAALNVIVQRGYAGATTREISAAAGMNEVTLFRRFGSKEQLLRAVVEQEAQRFSLMGIEYTGDLEGDLVRVVCFYRDLMRARGRIIAMLINEIPRQPELTDVMETPLQIFASSACIWSVPARHGMHLPQDSDLQNSMKYFATSTMHEVSSMMIMPPDPMMEPTFMSES